MNAFQFLHTREAYEDLFARVREHLTPDGYFLFETRNPTPENLYRAPGSNRYKTADGGQLVTAYEQVYDPIMQMQHYTTHQMFYRPDGTPEKERVLRVGLRYIYPQEMEALLYHNGLRIDTVYGDWAQNPLAADSPAMIYVVRHQ
jgi:hypothetical protein